jgi:hypothetical protein
MISALFMHQALRSSLAIVAIVACVGCQTQDRRIYTTHRDKNLHVPNPYAPSTSKAADEATAPLDNGAPPPDESGPPTETGQGQ